MVDDKSSLQTLLRAINGAKAALHLDGCRVWTIRGHRGHVFPWGDGATWGLYLQGRSVRHWNSLKAQCSTPIDMRKAR